jgi:hypothetical protein
MEKDSACSTYRPTVYEPGLRGLIAKWRGPALEWPLLDAVLLPGEAAAVCALHNCDFFISLNLKKRFVLRPINGMVSDLKVTERYQGALQMRDPEMIRVMLNKMVQTKLHSKNVIYSTHLWYY